MNKISIIIFLFITLRTSGQELLFVNEILYRISYQQFTSQLRFTKVINNGSFFIENSDSCFAQKIDFVEVQEMDVSKVHRYLEDFRVNIPPLFIYNGKFVNFEYFYLEDIESLDPLPKRNSIEKYGCKGIGPVFCIVLKKGKTIQSKPVNRLKFGY